MYDKQAERILFETFWKRGWKADASRNLSPDSFAYAKSKGYMFDEVLLSHDHLVGELIQESKRADSSAVTGAFLASLGNRKLALRSALGSYAFAKNFPAHGIANAQVTVVPSGARRCSVCGSYEFKTPKRTDLNVLNFERHKWGGVRRDSLEYAWLDLFLFNKEERQTPTEADKKMMKQIIQVSSSLAPNAAVSTLEKALSGVFKSSKNERRVLIEILAICGVLQPKNRKGYFREFAHDNEREHTGQNKNDWSYPAIWWRGADGVNHSALGHYFPEL
jgi:hypothetical protein